MNEPLTRSDRVTIRKDADFSDRYQSLLPTLRQSFLASLRGFQANECVGKIVNADNEGDCQYTVVFPSHQVFVFHADQLQKYTPVVRQVRRRYW